jgi:hypothetical protein
MSESIKLQFVRERGPMPGLISWWGGGRFSHVDTVLDDGRLLGARNDRRGGCPRGVQVRPPGYTDFIIREVMAVPVTVEQKAAYLDFLRNQVGKPYDSRALWGFVFNRDWHRADRWICSELVAAGAEQARIIPHLYFAVYQITPGALALAMSAVGGTIIE